MKTLSNKESVMDALTKSMEKHRYQILDDEAMQSILGRVGMNLQIIENRQPKKKTLSRLFDYDSFWLFIMVSALFFAAKIMAQTLAYMSVGR